MLIEPSRAIKRSATGIPEIRIIAFSISVLIAGCAGTAPYTTAPDHETTVIPGTDLWVVWLSPHEVERLDVHEARNSGSIDHIPGPDEFVAVQATPSANYSVNPRYPLEAEAAGREGLVRVKALVLSDGTVGAAMIKESSGLDLGFERAALEAAMQFSYRPGMQSGKPVALWHTYSVDFRLKD